MNVTVISASIPQRASMLAEAIQSVCDQSQPPFAHLIAVDVCRMGGPTMLNRLLAAVTTEWLMVLDDDDLLDPHHLKTLVGHSTDADVVYSYCRTEGRSFDQYNQPFDSVLLQRRSVVSHTALVRTSCVREVGGWHRERGYDWDLWKRIRGEGATFRSVPEVTWTYRLLGGNESWDGAADAPTHIVPGSAKTVFVSADADFRSYCWGPFGEEQSCADCGSRWVEDQQGHKMYSVVGAGGSACFHAMADVVAAP